MSTVIATGRYTGGALVHTELYVTDCPSCGVQFALTKEYQERRRKDGKSFSCPNGHLSSWMKSVQDDTLRRENERLILQRDNAQTRADAAYDQARTAEWRRRAAKAQLTKMRNRLQRGECPVGKCHAHFDDLQHHLYEKHPEFQGHLDDLMEDVRDDG